MTRQSSCTLQNAPSRSCCEASEVGWFSSSVEIRVYTHTRVMACLLSLAVAVLWRAEEIRTGAGSQGLSCRCLLALPQTFPGVDHDREHRACAVLAPYSHGDWRGAVRE